MTEEIKLNSNIRAKLTRRDASWLKVGCVCGGLKRYGLGSCFRPGGRACKRRARR